MNPAQSVPGLNRLQRFATIAGAVGIVACIAGAVIDSRQFFRSYLLGYIYWLGLALGSLGIVMLHNCVGGRWGVIIRKFVESGMRTLPLMAVLVIPILVGIPALYHWAHEDAVAADKVLQWKHAYLNVPFFIGRTILYFLIWIGLTLILRRRSPGTTLRAVSGPGLIIFVFSVTFAAVDWIMSLEPHWFSTIYGAILLVGQVLTALAFSIALLYYLSDREPFKEIIHPDYFHDLGNLMLAFTLLWAYTSFSQFLIIWSGNIPEETPWYLYRSRNGWQIVSVVLILFHFAVPFFVLLMRFVKRQGRLLARVALFMIFMRLVDLFYWIVPSEHQGFAVHWMDIAAPVAIGGVWIAAFVWLLSRGPLIDVHDPRLAVHGGH